MWELNNGSYYKWQDTNSGVPDLVASLIHHGPEDGANSHKWGVQIHTTDGNLVIIGYIREAHFDASVAKALADLALSEQHDYDWWIANAAIWWQAHSIDSVALKTARNL